MLPYLTMMDQIVFLTKGRFKIMRFCGSTISDETFQVAVSKI